MTSRAAAPLLALALPAACLGTAELFISLLSAGTDRPYVGYLGGWILLAQISVALLLGLVLTLLLGRLEPARRAAAALGLAGGLGVALGVLTVLANGLPRQVPPGTVPPALAWLAALGLGGAAGSLRWLMARRRHGPMALLWEPPLIALATVGMYGFLRLQRIPPATTTGAIIWMVGAAAAFLAALILGRLHINPAARVYGLLIMGAAGIAAGTLGSSARPFPTVPARAPGPPDILLVVMDTTRGDALPAAGSWSTPAAQRLAAEGRTFTRCFSTSCWTVPAHGSLFTGRLPRGHGATWDDPHLAPGPATLAERLAAAGWRTAGFSANPWIGAEFGFDRGFAHYVEASADRRPLRPWATAFLPTRLTAPGLDLFDDKGGLTLVSEALRHLEQPGDGPVFTFLNLLEPHLPYLPPRRLRDGIAAEFGRQQILAIDQDPLSGLVPDAGPDAWQMEILRALYAAEVTYADQLLGRLLQRLEESGRLDHTLVVLTSDHGENLGDHPPLDHQLGLHDTLLHVPLLMRYPGTIAAGVRDDQLVSLADLPGRILQLAGAEPAAAGGKAQPADGAERYDAKEEDGMGAASPAEPAVYFQYGRPGPILERIAARLNLDTAPWDRTLTGIRTATGKWIRASDGRHQAFDLANDPAEQTNLFSHAAALDARWQGLAARLEQRLPEIHEATPGATLDDISPETRERLRSLGYLD